MTNEIRRDDGFERARSEQRRAWLRTTAEQRILWLDQAKRFAAEALAAADRRRSSGAPRPARRRALLELPDYLVFGLATARMDHDEAAAALRRCLALAAEGYDLHHRISLWLSLGDAEARAGRPAASREAFEQAEDLDRTSPLTRIYFARCLVGVLGENASGASKLAEAERLLESWQPSKDDLDRSSYEELIDEVRSLLS